MEIIPKPFHRQIYITTSLMVNTCIARIENKIVVSASSNTCRYKSFVLNPCFVGKNSHH
jgi:hypothetical protein